MIGKIGGKILWLRAKSYIEKNHPLIIAVTGSYGKSLTKEAIALALKDSRRVRVSHKSYNTPVGVALSILGVQAAQSRLGWFGLLVGSKKREIGEAEPEIIVLEMGADRPGDIDWLVGQVPVKIGVVTSVGSTRSCRCQFRFNPGEQPFSTLTIRWC